MLASAAELLTALLWTAAGLAGLVTARADAEDEVWEPFLDPEGP